MTSPARLLESSTETETESLSVLNNDDESINMSQLDKPDGIQFRPTESVGIEFNDIRFEIEMKQGLPWHRRVTKRKILNGVSGKIEKGGCVAILGASGAGKTTFLDILSGRIKPTSGKVLIDNKAIAPGRKYPKQAYVRQQDFLMANFTPEELLYISAALRLPASISDYERKRKVQDILQEFSLVKCKDTRVGSTFQRGISGGEAKRLSVAIEMITDPSVLFLDEPTSGLDTTTAYTLVDTLRKLSDSGRTVVFTIHQPSSDIFALFKDVLLLANGQVVYFGTAKDAVSYFSNLGLECPRHYNPADFFFQLLNDSAVVPKLITAWQSHNKPRNLGPVEKFAKTAHSYVRSHIYQFALLGSRSIKDISRDNIQLRARLMQSLTVSLLLGLVCSLLSYFFIIFATFP
jgi:ATP-binding cassette subfamily G (WHITE) protein 2